MEFYSNSYDDLRALPFGILAIRASNFNKIMSNEIKLRVKLAGGKI